MTRAVVGLASSLLVAVRERFFHKGFETLLLLNGRVSGRPTFE
jgi:hypothetical protein